MKKYLAAILISIVTMTVAIAQNVPQGIAYQAVAIKDGPHSLGGQNASSFNWSNKDIQVRFTIFEKYPGGSNQYSEIHKTKTDEYGVFNLIIGQGQTINGVFENIQWDLGTAHLQVEIDFENNNTFKVTSFERFWSVPYAFVSNYKGVNNSKNDSAITALNNKFNYLKNRDKDTIIGNEGGVSYKSLDSLNQILKTQIAKMKLADKDTVIGNEWQNLTKKKDSILISNGSGIKLLDDDSLNELQNLVLINDSLKMTKSNKLVVLGPAIKSIVNSALAKNLASSSNSYNDCFSGVSIDLTEFCNQNGYTKTIFLGKSSDSICVFSAVNSSSETDVYTVNVFSNSFQILANNMNLNATNTLIKDSILYGGTGTIYLCNIKQRKWLDTISGILPMIDKRGCVITKLNDLISIQYSYSSMVGKWIIGNYCKYNFLTKKITTPNNPNNGQSTTDNYISTYIGGDTVLLGDRIVNAKTMTEIFQLNKLSKGSERNVIVWENKIYYNYMEVIQPDPKYQIYTYSAQILSFNPKTQGEEVLIKVNCGIGTSSTLSWGGANFIGINNNRLLISGPNLNAVPSSPPSTNWRLNNMTCTSPIPIYWVDKNNYLSLYGYENPVQEYAYRRPYIAFDFNGTPMCVNGFNLAYNQGFFFSNK
jgi:hypothetical protein